MGVKKKASVLPPVNAPKKIPGVYKAAPREEKKPRHQSPALNDAKMLNGDAGKVLCEHCHETKWFAMPICDQMKVTKVVSVQQVGRTVMYMARAGRTVRTVLPVARASGHCGIKNAN